MFKKIEMDIVNWGHLEYTVIVSSFPYNYVEMLSISAEWVGLQQIS